MLAERGTENSQNIVPEAGLPVEPEVQNFLVRAGLWFARAYNGDDGDYWAYWKRIPIAVGLGTVGSAALREFDAPSVYANLVQAVATFETARLLIMHSVNMGETFYNRIATLRSEGDRAVARGIDEEI